MLTIRDRAWALLIATWGGLLLAGCGAERMPATSGERKDPAIAEHPLRSAPAADPDEASPDQDGAGQTSSEEADAVDADSGDGESMAASEPPWPDQPTPPAMPRVRPKVAMTPLHTAARDPEPAAGESEPNGREPEAAARDPQPAPPREPKPTQGKPAQPKIAVPSHPAGTDSEVAAPPAVETPDGDYAVVRVFYGTDRAVQDPADAAGSGWVSLLVTTLGSAGLAMILAAVALRLRRTRAMQRLAVTAVAVTLLLGVWTVAVGLRGAIGTRESGPAQLVYGPKRGGQLHLGTCRVSIPKDHQVGEVEGPSILRLEFRENPERHVVLLDVKAEPAEQFYAQMRSCVEQSEVKGAFVFVHGYNVTFADAARRTAQMAYDLKFDGAPIFYSWPSQGTIAGYTIDETTVQTTVRYLKEFLADVARRSGAQRVHLIAHSMGNRALTAALRDLSFLSEQDRPKFHEVILTAPDIDADLFKTDIAPAIVKTARRVTLYASSHDKALAYSKTVHGYPRAGDSGSELLVLPGIDTVDVSAVDTSLLGHSYYGSNDSVLADLFELLHQGTTPDHRKWLRPEPFGALTYWIFQRIEAATRGGPELGNPAGSLR